MLVKQLPGDELLPPITRVLTLVSSYSGYNRTLENLLDRNGPE